LFFQFFYNVNNAGLSGKRVIFTVTASAVEIETIQFLTKAVAEVTCAKEICCKKNIGDEIKISPD